MQTNSCKQKELFCNVYLRYKNSSWKNKKTVQKQVEGRANEKIQIAFMITARSHASL